MTDSRSTLNNRNVLSRELPLLFAVFLDLTGFSAILPDIQTRLESFGARGLVIGVVLSSYFLVQILVSPRWGRWSDRVGRKPVLVVCGGLSAGSLLVYAFASNVGTVLASRILAGFAAANTAAAQAYAADTTPAGDARTAAMGRLGAAITAGLFLGPALGGWLSHLGGNHLLGIVAASASGLGALWIAVAVPAVAPVVDEVEAAELSADGEADVVKGKELKDAFGLRLLRDVPRLRPLFLLSIVAMLALACLEGTFGRLIRHRLGYGPEQYGAIFAWESLIGVGVQSLLLPTLTKRTTARARLVSAYLGQGIGLGLTPLAPSLPALFACSVPYAVGASVGSPTLSGLCSDATPPARQGEMFGLLQGARSLGFLVGPTIGGLLFDWRMEAPYFAAGAVMLTAATLCAFSRRIPPA